MSNRLHQLNAGYDALQDRILFSIGAEDGTEFRFWITRRYLLLLWSMLVKLATAFAGARASGDPIRREALAEMAHHQAHRDADFETSYRGGTQRPLGDEPVLLAKVAVKQDTAGRWTLTLLPNEGPGADIGVDENMTHLLASLLQRAASQAEWPLALAPLATPAMGEAAPPPRIH